MQSPEEIEGSAARAADRGQPIGFTFFDEASEKPYLGDPETVEGLVRSFLDDARLIAGEADASAKIAAKVEAISSAFYGQSEEYRAAGFNSTEQLGRFVNEQMGTGEGEDKSVPMLFWNLLTEVFSARQEFMDDKIADEAAKFRVDAAIDDACRILLGVAIADPE